MTGSTVSLWAWPDALVAAALAVGLAVLVVVPAARAGRSPGPAVAGVLVVALGGALLLHGRPLVAAVVVIVTAAVATASLLVRRRRSPGAVAGRRNEIAGAVRR